MSLTWWRKLSPAWKVLATVVAFVAGLTTIISYFHPGASNEADFSIKNSSQVKVGTLTTNSPRPAVKVEGSKEVDMGNVNHLSTDTGSNRLPRAIAIEGAKHVDMNNVRISTVNGHQDVSIDRVTMKSK